MIIIDLHTHSKASDGQYTAVELCRLASHHGIKLYSLTDHDTTGGIRDAHEECLNLNFLDN
ncbi:MAG: PHP domain-containing protein [Lachnospiraceae bacterium]|nr:PHP domain-containing protein [Lachnospiraceae bacterium]